VTEVSNKTISTDALTCCNRAVGTCLLEPTAKHNEVVDNPNCNYCEGAYETAAHFMGECDRYPPQDEKSGESHTYTQLIFDI